jgi:DNA-binding IclR family transcriptional regulator
MSDKYISEQQQRILSLISTLAGHELTGLAPSEIAKLQACDPSQVTREQIPETGRWRLGPQIVQISLKYSSGLSRAQARLDDISNRFSRV